MYWWAQSVQVCGQMLGGFEEKWRLVGSNVVSREHKSSLGEAKGITSVTHARPVLVASQAHVTADV